MADHADQHTSWRRAIAHAIPALGCVLYLLVRWFVVANRAIIFLIDHELGPDFDTTALGQMTVSRYWMAGLVACGALLAVAVAAGWLLGRVWRRYRAPDPRRVWAVSAPVLVVAVPLITMRLGTPHLPGSIAAQATVATLLGIALAALAYRAAVERPREAFWLALDGLGVGALTVTISSALSYLTRDTVHVRPVYLVVSGVLLAAGIGWLLFVAGVRWQRRAPPARVGELLIAGLAAAYLALPLAHHINTIVIDGYPYISGSENFFAATVGWQVVGWACTTIVTVGLTRLQAWLASRRALR